MSRIKSTNTVDYFKSWTIRLNVKVDYAMLLQKGRRVGLKDFYFLFKVEVGWEGVSFFFPSPISSYISLKGKVSFSFVQF
jgi:hypothetical protein